MNAQSNLLQQSQFIHGKFVSHNTYGYNIVAFTKDLNTNREKLNILLEGNNNYRFWVNRQPDNNPISVGICRNETEILSDRGFLLIHASHATKGQNALINGTRPFIQYRVIFARQELLSNFKNQVGVLLTRLASQIIPYFEMPPTDETWSYLNDDFLKHEIDEKRMRYESVEFIKQQYSLMVKEALQILLNKKRLLLTPDDGQSPLDFIDRILSWLPISYRQTLSIAAGSIDENECKWANIILKYNGKPSIRNNDSLIWLNDRGSSTRIQNIQNVNNNHPYITDFIQYLIDHPDEYLNDVNGTPGNGSAILTHLDEWYRPFDPANPSLEFILEFPFSQQDYAEYESKITELLSKYWNNVKADIILWIERMDARDLDRNWQILWKLFKQKSTEQLHEDILVPTMLLLKKMLMFLQPSHSQKITDIIQDPLFSREEFLRDLLHNDQKC